MNGLIKQKFPPVDRRLPIFRGRKAGNLPMILWSWAREFAARLALRLPLPGELHYINGPETLPPPLTREQEQEIFLQLSSPDRNAGQDARQQLIVHNLRLVVYIAKKFESTGIGVEDLTSIGTIGLIKAVNTFCPERKIKLATYASRCIENEILMYLRKNQNRRREISIDEPLNIDWDGNELLLSDVLGTEPDVVSSGIERESERLMLYQAIAGLEERERSIMELRFGLQKGGREHTQKEVADLIGISQSYISRLEKRIIRRLQKELKRMNRENREEN